MNEKALEEKLKEEASNNPIPLRDVPQYFKDYVIDEVVIVLPQTLRHGPNEGEIPIDGVYDGPARTREINMVEEREPDELVFIGEHLTEEESEKL